MVDRENSPLEELYFAWNQLNAVCWQGALPPCALVMSNRMRRALGSAAAGSPPVITLNITALAQGDDFLFLGVLAHEMVHSWQYAQGRRGGHGPDFRREMFRIGIDERSMQVRGDSPFHYCMEQRLLFRRSVLPALRLIAQGPFSRTADMVFFYRFQQQLFGRKA